MDMVDAAEGALRWVLHLAEGEKMLVVTDEERRRIGEAFQRAGERIGADVDLYVLTGERPFDEIPADLDAMIDGKDVVVNAFTGLPEETPFRIKLIRRETGTGARVGHAPGITEDMMTVGPMTADYRDVADLARRLMIAFEGAEKVHITAPGGTDIEVLISGRAFQTDVTIEKGHMGNLPSGEIWCAPIEDGANGRIVCDGSIGDLGEVPSPITIEVKDGRIVSISGDDKEFVDRVDELTHVDEMASVIGELGIGVNPKARITGNLLEDEKAWRTAHIAFGNNESMPGGKNTSKTHRDFLFHRPTFNVTFADGSTRILIKDGDILV